MVYGLDYTPSLLDSLCSVPSTHEASRMVPSTAVAPDDGVGTTRARTADSDGQAPLKNEEEGNPVRLLPAPVFSSFHLNHLVSHPPDHVLFPFLHGLEGENDAQNTFFANANAVVNAQADSDIGAVNSHHVVNVTVPNVQVQTHTSQQGNMIDPNSCSASSSTQTTTTHQLLRPKVPQYRGLVWVVCEDDLKDDKVTLSVLRRKPLPTGSSNAEGNDDDDMLLDDSDDDAMLTSSDEDDSDADDTTTSDSESSSFEGHNELQNDHGLGDAATCMIEQDEDRGILTSVPDDASPLGKPISKEALDSMPYMHPVVIPHQHQHSSQFASLPTLDTSNIAMSASASSSSGSEVESVFTSTTMSPATGTAATSISSSPLSASCTTSPYEHPQVIELQEATSANPVSIISEQESLQVQEHSLTSVRKPNSKGRVPKLKHKTKSKSRPPTDPAAPPLLTCTFRPKELLRRRKVTLTSKDPNSAPDVPPEVKKNSVWEFIPARIPDGISLRNFGIQVPIYATLSDIVIYSPKGPTPNALALAQRFREAIKRKREERITALKGIVYSQVHAYTQTYKSTRAAGGTSVKVQHHHITAESIAADEVTASALAAAATSAAAGAGHSYEEEEDIEARLLDAAERYLLNKVDEEMLDYNVFVLDANEEQMRKKIGHLMMHSCGSGVPGVEKPQPRISQPLSNPPSTGSHTVGTDGRLAEQDEEDVKMNSRSSEAGSEMDLVVGDIEIEVDTRIDSDGDINMADRSSSPKGREDLESTDINDEEPLPNTVDFALREREEMRDLTKASEIISLFPSSSSPNTTPTKATFTKGALYDSPPTGTPMDGGSSSRPAHLQHLSSILSPRSPGFSQTSLSSPPPEFTFKHPDPKVDLSSPASFSDPRVGQVFLGNSGDVPLLAEQPITTIENARARLEDPEADESALDDPFNYTATNSPAKGLGYDICIECHEMAPFPTPAHLRAAEEHLVTLERVWRDRTIRKEAQKIKVELEPQLEAAGQDETHLRVETRTLNIPPRPPPHANAIIHIPFPSSPPNSQATLAQLIPVMRFLEKWIRPVGDVHVEVEIEVVPPQTPVKSEEPVQDSNESSGTSGVRRWSSTVVSSILPSVFGNSNTANSSSSASTGVPPRSPSPPLSSSRSRSNTTPSPSNQLNSFPLHGAQASINQYSPSYSASYQQPRHQPPPPQRFAPTRPLKILIYSADGYTESSLLSLCLLMNVKGLSLPEAYLELQVAKRRSFFVYQHDLGILKRVESRLREERDREREKWREAERQRELREIQISAQRERERAERERVEREREMAGNGNGKRSLGSSFFRGLGMGGSSSPSVQSSSPDAAVGERRVKMGRPAAKSVSFSQVPSLPINTNSNVAKPSLPSIPALEMGALHSGHAEDFAKLGHPSTLPSSATALGQGQTSSSTFPTQGGSNIRHPATISAGHGKVQGIGRPRANTSPWLPSANGGDHQSWFNDPRFDGSFPSRVLPFLYLGNLNHASNVYMLHALGITHVVSVGECALLPPPFHMIGHANNGPAANGSPRAYKQSHPNTAGHGSLWIEEREGRIKVLDIKGVCDDGIDTLEPQLEPICDWIDKARAEGGQVLVHCRVGVSRSATVTIAYVMKHLSLPLVDAYLIVRSRRLSVLIQPNMRLLYNLCGWEIKLAKERAGLPSDYGKDLAPLGPNEASEKKREEKNLRRELARTLTWPYLSKEVHALNEKYLH